MSATTAADSICEEQRLELSRGEQWVVYHVALTHLLESKDPLEPGSPPPWWAVEVARKLEAEQSTLDCYEGWRLIEALTEYADQAETPEEDVAVAKSVLRRLEATFDRPPMTAGT